MISPIEVAGKWLIGEDAYQWRRDEQGKFPIESDVADLYKALGEGGWDEIFYNRWSSIMLFNANGPDFIPQTAQNLGKLAAGARALCVALSCAISPGYEVAAFEGSNNGSWSSILGRGFPALVPGVLEVPFDETRAGKLYTSIGLPLEEVGIVPETAQRNAKEFKHVTYELFGGYIAGLDDLSLIPKPGMPSGEIEPWVELQAQL